MPAKYANAQRAPNRRSLFSAHDGRRSSSDVAAQAYAPSRSGLRSMGQAHDDAAEARSRDELLPSSREAARAAQATSATAAARRRGLCLRMVMPPLSIYDLKVRVICLALKKNSRRLSRRTVSRLKGASSGF